MSGSLVSQPWAPVVGAAIGLVGGLVGGLFGLGGGVLILPALILVLGLPHLQAAAVSLVAIALGTATSLIPFISLGRVAWADGIVLAVAATLGAWIGVAVAHRIPDRVLAWGFVAVVLAAAARMILPGATGSLDTAPLTVASVAILVGVGLVAGTLGTTIGIGGGAIYVPSLVFLLDLTQHSAQGTSLLAILPSALMASLGNARAHRVRWRVAGPVAGGSLVGGYAGASLAQQVPADRLQSAFAILLVVLAVRMVVTASRRDRGEQPPPSVP